MPMKQSIDRANISRKYEVIALAGKFQLEVQIASDNKHLEIM